MKHRYLFIFFAIIILFSGLAISETIHLKISSSQPLSTQFQQFETYLNSLNTSDKKAWIQELQTVTKSSSSNSIKIKPNNTQKKKSDTNKNITVWISRTGKKYHSSSRCSNMKSPSEVKLSEAKYLGYTPCSKCKPPK